MADNKQICIVTDLGDKDIDDYFSLIYIIGLILDGKIKNCTIHVVISDAMSGFSQINSGFTEKFFFKPTDGRPWVYGDFLDNFKSIA